MNTPHTSLSLFSIGIAAVLALLGIASIAGGVMVMRLRTGSSFYVVWYVLGALLLVVAIVTAAGLWSAIPGPIKRVGVGLLCLGVIWIGGTQALVATQFSTEGEPDLDYMIVLGAQVHENGAPSTVLRYRLDAACDYLKENPSTTCIVSGGQGPNETMPEAEGMANYLIEHGIDASRIVLETESTNTVENLTNSMKLIDPAQDRVGIVTNNFHVFRSLAIARKLGMKHVCGIAAYTTPAYLPNNLFRESFGITKDFLQGNL